MLRVIAAICVLWLHMPIVLKHQLYGNSVFEFFLKALVTVAHIGTPIFTMIMGSLLLRKDEDILYILKHRMSRVLLLLLVLSIYYVVSDYYNDGRLVVSNVIYYMLNLTSKSLIYWYIYWWLSVIIALPLLRPLVKSSLLSNKNGGGMELLFYSFFTFECCYKFY